VHVCGGGCTPAIVVVAAFIFHACTPPSLLLWPPLTANRCRKLGPGGAKLPLPVFGGARGPDITRSLLTIEATFEGYMSLLR